MNLMLKIVQGPNAGAEIALVDGLCVTLGRNDSCDIVLADSLLPAEPVQLETQSDGVAMTAPEGGRVHLTPYHVVTIGATSFAIGPADAPWEPLVWPEPEKTPSAEASGESEAPPPPASEPETPPAEEPGGKRRRPGCLVAALVVLALLLLLAWLLLLFVRRGGESVQTCGWAERLKALCAPAPAAEAPPAAPKETVESLARRYALVETNVKGRVVLSGNFRTRAERLAAAGEIYALKPGADLDLSDDESFRSAAEDLVFTLTEGSLKVVAATNRVLALSGTSPSAVVLKKTLRAVSADLPRLENVDCSAVRLGDCGSARREEDAKVDVGAVAADWVKAREPRPAAAVRKTGSFAPPLCGILTTPYPCLVLRNGARVLEGATFAGSTIVKIEADSVVVTNATGRFTWKP